MNDGVWITLFVHGNSRYLVPGYIEITKMGAYLLELEAQAKALMERSGAAHVVYAVKSYKDDVLDQLDAYMEPMDDETFYSRKADEQKSNPGCIIYALHNRGQSKQAGPGGKSRQKERGEQGTTFPWAKGYASERGGYTLAPIHS